ncbi:MAG: hexose kinase [Candidatus Lokiarchaeota archaeon]|nr:hexose kinase [Candidatus Lokiarchaeota archaeon]MBD3340822.1 hexose kinase [Candidatus Lokiarchaeota archaeon]
MTLHCFCLNPTIDEIYEIEDFYVGGTFKVKEKVIYPVGKAISFCLAITNIRKNFDFVNLLACIGKGETSLYSEFLKGKKINFQLISVKGKTRSNKTVNDPVNRTTTHIRESGFKFSRKKITEIKKFVKSNVKPNDLCLFSGSLPPNVNNDLYAELIKLCNHKNAKCILDTSDSSLVKAIDSKPFIVKPNLLELSQILQNSKLNEIDFSDEQKDLSYIVNQAERLLQKGIKTILITLGKKGAICLTKSITLYGNVYVDVSIDTVGCGDAFLAGFVSHYLLERNTQECFRSAIAAGAANTQEKGPGIFKHKTYENLLEKVKIKKIH